MWGINPGFTLLNAVFTHKAALGYHGHDFHDIILRRDNVTYFIDSKIKMQLQKFMKS